MGLEATSDEGSLRIVLTGGSTGGHVAVALAVAEVVRAKLARSGQAPTFLYVGSRTGVERAMVEQAGIEFAAVATGKWRAYASLDNVTDALSVPLGVIQARRLLAAFQPHVVLSTGGFSAVPAVMAARSLRVPIVAHEQTATIGLANQLIAPCARTIALAQPASVGELRPRQRTRAIITGNPIRPELRHGDAARALATLGWPAAAEGEAELEAGAELGADDDDLPVVYVTGGTQGARSINRVIETALPALLPVCRIIHQCGGGADNGVSELDRLTAAAAALSPQLCDRYRPLAFLDLTLLADIYALATLVVGRAGAGTTTELAELGKASVLIPLVPTRRDEQRRNSRLLEDAGAAVVLPQAELSSARLAEVVVELLRDPEQLRRMGKAALQLAHPDAADRLADLVLAAIRTRSA